MSKTGEIFHVQFYGEEKQQYEKIFQIVHIAFI